MPRPDRCLDATDAGQLIGVRHLPGGHRRARIVHFDEGDQFGQSVAIDGDTIVVGAPQEDSSSTGVNGNQLNESADGAGATYVFTRTGTAWSQQAYLKASNAQSPDVFGTAVALSADTIVVTAVIDFAASLQV